MIHPSDVANVPANVVLLNGSAHPSLAAAVAHELGLGCGACVIRRFPDGEIHLDVEAREVEGRDVFVLQPTSNDAATHMFELLLAADACRHAGARTVTALVPYFGYARQDRRSRPGEALAARVAAKLLGSERFDRIVALDLHGETLEAALEAPVEHLSAVPVLAAALEPAVTRDAVVVAPDLGAARLAREYGRILKLPVALVHKLRKSATDVAVERVAGDVAGKQPIVVDDIISTAGTIVAATRALHERGATGEVVVAATHAVLASSALDRLHGAGLRRVYVTDSVPMVESDSLVTVVSIAPTLASCVRQFAMRRLGPSYVLHP